GRDLREDAVDVLDVELRLLRAANGEEGLCAPLTARAEADAGEGLLDLAGAGSAATRGEVGRLAGLARRLAAVARPGAGRGVVDVVGRAEVAVQDEVMALRILAQLLAGEAEVLTARVEELGGNLGRDVVVGGEAELVLAVRLEVPGRHDELNALVRRRRI